MTMRSGLPVLGRYENVVDIDLGDWIEYLSLSNDLSDIYKGRVIAIYHREQYLKVIPELEDKSSASAVVCVPFKCVFTRLSNRNGVPY